MSASSAPTTDLDDTAALAKGGRTSFFGFVLRLVGRVPFLFFSGRLYGPEELGRFAYAVLVVEFAAQLTTLGLKRGLAYELSSVPHEKQTNAVWDAMLATIVASIAAALVLTRVAITRDVGLILFASVTCYGLSIAIFALSTSFPLSLAAMAGLGASDMVSVYIRLTLLQVATPDEMRGRVNAVNAVFTGTSNEIGDFRAGTMAAAIGAVGAALAGGLGAIAIAAIFWKLFPELRTVQRMDRQL